VQRYYKDRAVVKFFLKKSIFFRTFVVAEGNETVTNCDRLKMFASDGKMRFTDVTDIEQVLRLIQSIPAVKMPNNLVNGVRLSNN